MPKIVVKKKAEVIAEFKFTKRPIVNIGSSKANDIVVPDKNVSEFHCSLSRKDDRYEIKDKNTLSGTRVNGKQVTEQGLKSGDTISVGSYDLVLDLDARRLKSGPADGGEEGAGKTYFLLGIYGRFEGKKFQLPAGETYIGRENVSPKGIENDIVLAADMTVSKGHAKISCSPNQCSIMDVGSTGGVAVNGAKVGQLNEVTIKSGDEIAIGRTIFRFVEDTGEDYSVPKNHRILLLKLRQPISLLISLVVLLFGASLVVRGLGGLSVLGSKQRKMDIDINRYWSPEENVVRTSLPDYDIASSPAIGDINSDGKADIVYLNSSGLLYAWDGRKGGLIWRPVEVFNSGKMSPVIADMNSDGIRDIVVVSDTSMLYIIDGQSGGVIRREMLGGLIAELSPAVCDLDGDGRMDVVVCSEEGMIHFVYAPGFETGMDKYTEFVDGPIYASPVVISTKKISPMVAIASFASKVYFFDGKSRGKKTVDLVEKTNKAHLIGGSPAIGDLNGDGTPEIIVQSNVPQYVSAIDITRFDVLWTYFVEPIPPAGLKHTSSPVVVDANGDGQGDVAVLSANGKAYMLKGNTGFPAGELLWKADLDGTGRIIAAPALQDFDRNGIVDLIFGAEDGTVYILRNIPSRRELEVFASLKASNVPITSSLAIGDTNGDGKMEVVYSNVLNAVQVLNTNIRTFKNSMSWPLYLADGLHSGVVQQGEKASTFMVMILAGIAVSVLYIVFKFYFNMKKLAKRPKVTYL